MNDGEIFAKSVRSRQFQFIQQGEEYVDGTKPRLQSILVGQFVEFAEQICSQLEMIFEASPLGSDARATSALEPLERNFAGQNHSIELVEDRVFVFG